MKIDKVNIKNFKNYFGEVCFDLTKRITILHGDNGFGKSSFFDAIEWCFTNKISRFDGNDGEIKRDIINKNGISLEEETVTVSIEFGGNKLTRWFSISGSEFGNTQVVLVEKDGSVHRGQVPVENFLKRGVFEGTNFGRGGYGQLIKQTYILSQNQVAAFVITEDPSERFRALANIMGFKALLNESDNMKKIYSSLVTQSDIVDKEINACSESIKSKEETKRQIDIFDFNLKLQNVGITNFNSNIDMQIKESQQRALSNKINTEKFIELYDELHLGRFENVDMILQQINQKRIVQNNLKGREDNTKTLQTKLKHRISTLKNEQKNIQKYNEIREGIKVKEQELGFYGISDFNLEIIKENLSDLRERASRIEFALSFQPSITSNLIQQQSLPTELKFLSRRKDSLNNKKERLLVLRDKLTHVIQECKDNLLVQLISNMKDIQNYVVANKLEKCPVCSSIPDGKLDSCIEHNILSYTAKVQEDTFYLNKSILLKNKIESNLRRTEERISESDTDLTRINLQIKRLEDEYNKYKSNILYSEELSQSSITTLNIELKDTIEKITLQQKIIESIISLNSLQEELKGEESIASLSAKRTRTENEIGQSIIRFNKAIERISIYLEKLESDLKRLYSDIQDDEFVIKRISSFIKREQYGVPIEVLINSEKKSLKKHEININKLSDVHEIQYSFKINQQIESQIKVLEEKKEFLISKKEEIDKIAFALRTHMGKLFDFFDSDAKDYLNSDTSPIQKYYRYLNPLPSNSLIQFDGSDEKLSIKVLFQQGGSGSNAKNILSSGQLNVLAISIFLAINEGQNIHSLDFVAIDDPIQNMDDVNQYSICDVLGQIKKQLIFSTHDLDFVKLFLKKNEHVKEDIQVFSFTSPYLNQEKIKHISYK
ncbi:SMC family ATPase [Paenibacillus polymyxa]|uniref:SMC family ATPase n=1 Tax=Paenibacillus polymyxa TaxID=1406 RepID=UPI002ED4551F|nr:SMC family ATPase [Paenibacillus polymyxa]